MQSPIILLALLGLVACAPKVPDSGAGVGFGDYSDYVRQREAGQTGQVGQPLNAVPTQPTFSTSAVGAALDNAETRTTPPTGRVIGQTPPVTNSAATNSAADTLAADRPRGDAPAGIRTETGEMQAATGISDEQDFKAVASRETISSDAERIARNRAQYEVIAPTALPQRDGSSGPSIVQFALSTTHAPGVQMYKRSSLFGGNGSGCAKFASPDLAQEAFLAKGGPEKDRSGLDPDGDGFACGWDPRPFRNALK
jgi:hypothetical protein